MDITQKDLVNGVLLLYHLPVWHGNANTIAEHANAFSRHSRFKVWSVNTALGFPNGLAALKFRIVVFHYSLPLGLAGTGFTHYLDSLSSSYKIAFFQDEYHQCQHRFDFINTYKIDCVYTLLKPQQFSDIYRKYTEVPKLVHNIPGYVSERLIEAGHRFTIPEQLRKFDIRYRGRRLPYYMGSGALEKQQIAVDFAQRANGLKLKTDLQTQEKRRIYGDGWYKFLADSRAVLGVETGVSVFDTTGEAQEECERLLALNPDASFEEISESFLHQWEDRIYYRTIGPRHFEAAALRVCQILFEGEYSGIMQPMVHYIPLRKDFSNFEEVIEMFKDRELRLKLTDTAYRDLIGSGRYSDRSFIESFDDELINSGFEPEISAAEAERITATIRADRVARLIKKIPYIALVFPYPGRDISFPVENLVRTALRRYKRR